MYKSWLSLEIAIHITRYIHSSHILIYYSYSCAHHNIKFTGHLPMSANIVLCKMFSWSKCYFKYQLCFVSVKIVFTEQLSQMIYNVYAFVHIIISEHTYLHCTCDLFCADVADCCYWVRAFTILNVQETLSNSNKMLL